MCCHNFYPISIYVPPILQSWDPIYLKTCYFNRLYLIVCLYVSLTALWDGFFIYLVGPCHHGGDTQCRSWLRHCATSRKVADSIPESVTGIFHWHNPFDRIMALGLSQLLTEVSTRNNSWGKDGRCVGLTTLPNLICRLYSNLGASTSWNPQGLSRPVVGLLYRHYGMTRP
jgi:hypothetical protein